MKKLAIILMLCITPFCQSQSDLLERFNFATFTDPVATAKDGFNLGIEVEYQVNWFYIRPSLFWFPELRGKTYTDLIGSLGYNLHLNKLSDYNWRAYTGLRLGTIFRGQQPHATYGFEAGIDHYFKNGFFIGCRATYDRRTDAKVWGTNEPVYWGESGYIRIGTTF